MSDYNDKELRETLELIDKSIHKVNRVLEENEYHESYVARLVEALNKLHYVKMALEAFND